MWSEEREFNLLNERIQSFKRSTYDYFWKFYGMIFVRLENIMILLMWFYRFGTTMFHTLSLLITRKTKIGCARLMIILFFLGVVLNSSKELLTTLTLYNRYDIKMISTLYVVNLFCHICFVLHEHLRSKILFLMCHHGFVF